MKIALSLTDQSFTATKSVGIFNVSMGLARGLMLCPEVTELHILGNEECSPAFEEIPSHVHLHLLDKPVPHHFGRLWWDQIGLPAALRRIAADWVILPKGFPPFFSKICGSKVACYVHDVIWEYYEGRRDADSPFPWHELMYFRTLAKRALATSDMVLTSTHFNKARFHEHAPNAKIAVIGIGFDTQITRNATRGGNDILLYASPFPHKLTNLGIKRLEAWIAQRADAAQIRLHILGRLPEGTELTHPAWIKHNRLPQRELDMLLDSCRATVYCSAYEGFGMPPVESLRRGLPCVASDIPPIRENIPERYLFNNNSEISFINCLNQAYDTPGLPDCPIFPDWATVAQRCIHALTGGSPVS